MDDRPTIEPVHVVALNSTARASTCGKCNLSKLLAPTTRIIEIPMEATATKSKPLVIHPDQGSDVFAFGNKIQFKLSAAETDGAFDLGTAVTPPGGGTPLHVHHKDDELFIIIEGELEFFLEGEWKKAGPGAVVYGPKEFPHKFRNVTDAPARHWVLTLPSGFERFYRRSGEVFANPPIDFAKLAEITAEHGSELLEKPEAPKEKV